ncbi:hypothetical protein GGI15_001596 [Coemansia interrupta]|uniref:FAD dependent oxidoreductase domain-containing protein n=1 Tax=Coemansia interrupta TaxID=1126814 RepID=A0A9W8HPX9_9FUNG|nr:hypothetical protein GGI15_001596 [Coemansia interrupta]
MSSQPVIVIGAGVIGLTVANKLLQSTCYDVTVVAEHIPGTIFSASMRSPKWASPWAGAHWRAWSSNEDKPLQQMEIQTYNEMLDLAVNEPESGISTATGIDLYENLTENPWYSTMLPPGVSHGIQYTTLVINVPKYLLYLKTKFTDAGGKITFKDASSAKQFYVVHCYGHAGYGYQSSLAFAKRVCELVDEAA